MGQRNGSRPSGGGGGGGMSGGRGGERGGRSNGTSRNDRPSQERTEIVKIDFWFDALLNAK